jgi:hypothetical protein
VNSGLKLLSNYYQIDTIIVMIGIAIERRWSIYFRNQKSQQYQCLTVDQLLVVRKDRNIHIPLEATPTYRTPLGGVIGGGMAVHQRVDLGDLFVDESTYALIQEIFGSSDLGVVKNSEYKIAPLTPKEIEDRRVEIMEQAMGRREDAINRRAQKIFLELQKRYPRVSFIRDDVAGFIMQEEKTIYDSLQKEMPDVKTYIRAIKAFKKPERSVRT